MKSKLFILSFILVLISCRTKKESNLNVDSFVGLDLNGKEIQFKNLNSPRLALNVYSPTCIPCFKEIPTLNYLRQEIIRSGLGEFYMVVDPISITDGFENKSFDSVYAEAKSIMIDEIEKRKIELPVVIMKPPFHVNPGGGLITGTPETLLFKTNPLILYYNFIGSISEKQDPEEIKNDLKVKFFKKTIGGI